MHRRNKNSENDLQQSYAKRITTRINRTNNKLKMTKKLKQERKQTCQRDSVDEQENQGAPDE